MPSLAELVNFTLAFVNTNLEFLSTLLNLTVLASKNATLINSGQNLNFSNVWGIIYGILLTGSYSTSIFSQTFSVAAANQSALANIGNAVNYFGSNVTAIIGDFDGKAGLSYLLNNTTIRLKTCQTDLWNFSYNLVNLTKNAVSFLIELGNATDKTFYS